MYEKVTFAELIRAYRKNLNINQTEFGEMIGVTQGAVANWETNRTTPSSNDLVNLSRLLDISLRELSDAAVYSKKLKNEDANRRFTVALDSKVRPDELLERFDIKLDDKSLTPEELKKAIEFIQFNRFSNPQS